MDETSITTNAAEATATETLTYANYHSIITGVDRTWQYGGFPLPDGTFWYYREPNATIVVEGDRAAKSLLSGNKRRVVWVRLPAISTMALSP